MDTSLPHRFIYRDAWDGALQRRSQLAAEARSQLTQLSPRFEDIYRRRFARVAASVIAIAIAVVLAAAALMGTAPGADLSRILLSVLVFAPFTWLFASIAARLHFRRRLALLLAESEDPFRDIARFETSPPRRIAESLVAELEVLSVGLPMIALSLLTPLLLHLGAYTLMNDLRTNLAEFGVWIRLSVLIVGHAHLALAYQAWRYAKGLSDLPSEELRVTESPTTKALGFTILVSAVPGVILLALPPTIVAVTGIIFVPAMFGWARRALARERLAVGDA